MKRRLDGGRLERRGCVSGRLCRQTSHSMVDVVHHLSKFWAVEFFFVDFLQAWVADGVSAYDASGRDFLLDRFFSVFHRQVLKDQNFFQLLSERIYSVVVLLHIWRFLAWARSTLFRVEAFHAIVATQRGRRGLTARKVKRIIRRSTLNNRVEWMVHHVWWQPLICSTTEISTFINMSCTFDLILLTNVLRRWNNVEVAAIERRHASGLQGTQLHRYGAVIISQLRLLRRRSSTQTVHNQRQLEMETWNKRLIGSFILIDSIIN